MIWSSATGSETFALARLFSNSPMERRPSSVLFCNNSQCVSTLLRCLHFSIGNAVCQNEKLKGKISLSRINLDFQWLAGWDGLKVSYALWMCFKKRTALTAPPQRCFFRGVLVSRFVNWKKRQLQWTWDKRQCPQKTSCFSPVLTTQYTIL